MFAKDPQENNGRSIQAYARSGGILYLVIIFLGVVGEAVIRNSLVVRGDAAATAQRILEAEFLWRLGIAGQLVLLVAGVALLMVWYVLLRPVSRNFAMLMVFFVLVSLAVESISGFYLHATLAPLTNAALQGLDPSQLHALVYMNVIAHSHTFGMALVFFGVACLLVGYLIRKSGYLPKLIGVLMQIAGVCYLLNSFARILVPELAGLLFPMILLPAFIAESTFALWLLIKGVDVAVWQRKTGENFRTNPRA